jgi:hypothetical protein
MKQFRGLLFVFLMAVVAGGLLPSVFTPTATADIPCINSDCFGDCIDLPRPLTRLPECDCAYRYGCSGATPYPELETIKQCDGVFCYYVVGCSDFCF